MSINLFMTGSIEHYHQKGHLDKEEIEQAENNNGGDAVIFHDLESLVRNNVNNNNNDNNPVSQPETSTFYDVEALVRGAAAATKGEEDATAATTTNNIGSTHKKNSKEQDQTDDTSKVKTTNTPPSAPTPPVFESLRDIHQSSNNNAGSDNIVSEHQKYSKEQNAHNPPSPPPTPPPTNSLTANPTLDIRRVNPAPEVKDEGEECKASEDGGYFGGSQGVGARNGGVVLRYQYEVHESGSSAGHDYTRDILPKLEEAISDALIPVFFEECLTNDDDDDEQQRGRRRWLLEDGLLDGLASQFGQSNNNMLRHNNRRLTKVVGIDAKPEDIPLRQQGCESEFIPSDPNVQCHRMEGALTLYFPPNSPIHSSTLSSTTLTMLRAIEGGMNDGSLLLSHPDIRKLHFAAKESYSDFPELGRGGASDSNGGVMVGNDPDGSNLGLILGIAIPLLLVCCCCLGFGAWKVLRRDSLNDNDDDGESSHVEMVMPEDKAFDDEEGDDEDYTDSSSDDYDDDYDEEDEDADSGSDYAEDDDDHGTADASESYDEMDAEEGGSARSQSQDQEEPSPNNRDYWDFDDDYDDYYEEESEASYPAPAATAASNPLDPIFEEAEKERAKKRKARKLRNRVRRRMERMEQANDDDEDYDESFEDDASQ